MCLQSHHQLPANSYGERSQQRMSFIGNLTFRYWKHLMKHLKVTNTKQLALYSSPLDVANLIGQTFASVSSSDSHSPVFQVTKNRLERTNINFRGRQPLPYNCDFDMFELKRALSSAHNTSPGPDGISYELLRYLTDDSLVSLLYLFKRIWREQVYPTQWQEAIVIPIVKPGKDPQTPLSYRPIALTSCLCKALERMVNARLVF
ncbi:putative RNA-directed DNA polymerase from transposon X-element [Trichonephila clavipes]|nr:putative RNA-directed DNA polymerase from transposon X-element [Trichonephila clavipes]